MVSGQTERHRGKEEGGAPEVHPRQGQSPGPGQRPAEGEQEHRHQLHHWKDEEESGRQGNQPEPGKEAGQGIVSQPVMFSFFFSLSH